MEGEWNGESKEKGREERKEDVCVCAVADGVETIIRNFTQ